VKNGREANLTKQVEVLRNKVLFVCLLCFVRYLLFRVELQVMPWRGTFPLQKGRN